VKAVAEQSVVINTQPRPPRPFRRRSDFIARTLSGFARRVQRALEAEELAKAGGLLQRLDPRVKVIGLALLLIDSALARNASAIAGILVSAILLALLSRVPPRTLFLRVWLSAFVFTSFIAAPAIFITPGSVAFRLPLLQWIVTEQGLRGALYLLLRVETAVTLSLLLVLTTLWTHVLKALRVLGVPAVFVVILGMTHRYIFLMMQTAQDIFESRRSRTVGNLDGRELRRSAAAGVGVLLTKSFHLSGEVYLAMQSRGFRGEVFTLDDFKMRARDWAALLLFVLLAVAAFRLGQQG
jgi:cobalt/nickel transport system permease protein